MPNLPDKLQILIADLDRAISEARGRFNALLAETTDSVIEDADDILDDVQSALLDAADALDVYRAAIAPVSDAPASE